MTDDRADLTWPLVGRQWKGSREMEFQGHQKGEIPLENQCQEHLEVAEGPGMCCKKHTWVIAIGDDGCQNVNSRVHPILTTYHLHHVSPTMMRGPFGCFLIDWSIVLLILRSLLS